MLQLTFLMNFISLHWKVVRQLLTLRVEVKKLLLRILNCHQTLQTQ